MENYVTVDALNERLFDKLHKREFEKHYERLDSICRMMENKVETAIPAMKYQLDQGIRSKADMAEIKRLQEDRASAAVVEALITRINKLEEKIKFELVNDKASLSGSEDESDMEGDHPNAIKEEENEDDDSDKPKKRRPASSKITKPKPEEVKEEVKKPAPVPETTIQVQSLDPAEKTAPSEHHEQPKPGSGQSKRSIGGTLSKELTKAMQQRVD